MALAIDAWGAVRAHPTSDGVLMDDRVNDRAASKCSYIGERHGEEALLMGEYTQAQEVKDNVQLTGRIFGIIFIFSIKCAA